MSVDHGSTRSAVEVAVGRRLAPLSLRAARCLLVARELADRTGEVPGGQKAIAKHMGVRDLRNVRQALAELETRKMAKRVGALRVLLLGSGGSARSVVDEQVEPPPLVQRWRRDRGRPRNEPDARYPGGTADPEFRWLRAQIGGLKRANADFKAQRDEARSLIAKIEARPASGDRVAGALMRDLEHAADCGNPDCALCLRIVEQIEDPDGPYLSVVGGG